MSGRTKWWVREREQAVEEPAADEAPDLETLTKAELVAEAEARGLDPSGTKADLLERLSDG